MKIKYFFIENIKWHCMQLELNLNSIEENGMQIGMKAFQNLLVTMAWGKKPSKKKRTIDET